MKESLDLPDYVPAKQRYPPQLSATVEESQVKTIISEEIVVWRKRKNDLGRAHNETMTCFLRHNSTKEMKKIGQHDTMGKIRLIIKTIDPTIILGGSCGRESVVEIET